MSARKVLVADDEAHITHVLALKLRNAGFDVRTAHDGEEAFELAVQDPPDILITDLQMPYMTGLELSIKLKKNASTATTPIIMLTARGHALSESDLAGTNIRMVLSKPFSPRDVLEKVEHVLGASDRAAPAKEAA